MAVLLLFARCANPVTPTGGPKDEKPPRVMECDPPNQSVRFRDRSIRIEFDEFVTLKNPVSEIFISPPLRHAPETRLRGRSLLIDIKDTLAPGTTYSITFGNALTDLTEGNILKGFNYVFSTGDYIDSLSMQGNVALAFDHRPQKDIFVELYLNNNDTLALDSLPLHVPPYYVTKSDADGRFRFNNLRDAPFRLIALGDQNGDLIFNQPAERIAFSDSLVRPFYERVAKKDTAVADSAKAGVAAVTDTLKTVAAQSDSTTVTQVAVPPPPVHSLLLFEEVDSVQRIRKVSAPSEGVALLAFRFPVRDLKVTPLNFDSVAPWQRTEFSRKSDSVWLWVTRPATDSLIARVTVGDKVLDTIRMQLNKPESDKKGSKKEQLKRLALQTPFSTAGLNQYKNKLKIKFSYPLSKWDFSRVLLIKGKDTLRPSVTFADSIRRSIFLDTKWEEDKNYRILIPDSTFVGINGLSQDTVRIDFKTRSERDFGSLVVNMKQENRPGRYIIQLLNEAETVIYEEHFIDGSGPVRFEFIPPGKYKLKAIHDRNGNGRWDTGNYRKLSQPETVIYFPKTLEIRGNWEVEETWN